MEENTQVLTLSAREADRNLAAAIDRVMTGSARAVLLTRHGFNVGNYIWPRRISRADVADFMLEQLNDDTYIATAPGVCN